MVSEGNKLMSDARDIFEAILETLSNENDDVIAGKMMSSDGIKYKAKVFAFFHKEQMVFKLGREFEPETHGINNFSILSPFKNKAPLYDWLEIPYASQMHWESLTRIALTRMVEELA